MGGEGRGGTHWSDRQVGLHLLPVDAVVVAVVGLREALQSPAPALRAPLGATLRPGAYPGRALPTANPANPAATAAIAS